MSNMDRNFEINLKAINGITDTYGIYAAEDVNVAGYNEPIAAMEGVDKDKYLKYFKLEVVDGNEDLLKELDSGRNIILNSSLGYKYNKKKGDLITLELGKGKREYKIIGFINTLMEKGNYAMIAENYFKMDTSERCYSYVLINITKDPNEVVSMLKKKYIDNKPYVQSLKKDKQEVIKNNEQIFLVLKGFSVLTIIMGILGVFNNFLISFMERKRSLAVFRSIGMSKQQIIKMIFIESLTGGLIGGIIGVIGGILMTSVFPYIMKAMDMPIPITYSTSILFISILTSIAITLIVSISPAIKSSKLNIIETIRNE
jgi:putative ABC transport system permease protein